MNRILIINNGYPNEQYPNFCTYIASIEKCLVDAGFETEMLALVKTKNKYKDYYRFYKKLLFHKYDHYDYIYVHHWPFVFLPFIFRKINKKVIVNFHGSDLMAESKVKKLINNWSYRFIPKKADFVVPSNYFKNICQDKFNNNYKIHVIPSGGVDTSKFKIINDNYYNNEIILGFASGINKGKGAFTLLEALNDINVNDKDILVKVKVNVIRYGSDIEEFDKKINDYKLNEVINFIEPIKKDEMPYFYNSINYLVFPTEREALGLVGLESMACGRPIIATNDFAITEYIEHNKTGFLFDKGNYLQLSEIIISLCRNNSTIHEMPVKCENYIKLNYSSDSLVGRYRQVFNK